MSNLIHRIMSNAIVFALLMSASLISYANDIESHSDSVTPTAHFIACDSTDPANTDTDFDKHTPSLIASAAQPLPDGRVAVYVNPCSVISVFSAHQRGPPAF
ncbi:hypothetical protein ACSSVW_002684 [Pseudoalteromonas sp. MBR-15]|uniref:hypothetical protein n=1 Tax=Pseudoalteromonas TaxID=53246 RepID=UPI0015D52D26|nr:MULTISPECIES: hypothetical protein [unclassified Pseudoalteromonas]MCC9661643.1 hypothetical protein [Pseudoalteromonas sp. MB41]QLJ08107.1 hypothetical protein GZH31_15265 [Pseudoalteromonas sp. JSTW]